MSTQDERIAALYNLYDIMELAMIPYCLATETAYSVIHDKDLPDTIKAVVHISEASKEALERIEHWVPECDIKRKLGKYLSSVQWDYMGTPIHIVFTESKEFIEHPDKKVFGVEQFPLPNPFDEYWKAYKKDEK